MAWLDEPMGSWLPEKRPDLLKLFFSGVLDKEAILNRLHRRLDLHRAQLAEYEHETKAYVEQIIAATGSVREGVMWGLVRQFGEEHERSWIRWLERAIETVERIPRGYQTRGPTSRALSQSEDASPRRCRQATVTMQGLPSVPFARMNDQQLWSIGLGEGDEEGH